MKQNQEETETSWSEQFNPNVYFKIQESEHDVTMNTSLVSSFRPITEVIEHNSIKPTNVFVSSTNVINISFKNINGDYPEYSAILW